MVLFWYSLHDLCSYGAGGWERVVSLIRLCSRMQETSLYLAYNSSQSFSRLMKSLCCIKVLTALSLDFSQCFPLAYSFGCCFSSFKRYHLSKHLNAVVWKVYQFIKLHRFAAKPSVSLLLWFPKLQVWCSSSVFASILRTVLRKLSKLMCFIQDLMKKAAEVHWHIRGK